MDCRQPGSYTYCAVHIGELWLPTTVNPPSSMRTDSLHPEETFAEECFMGVLVMGQTVAVEEDVAEGVAEEIN